MDNNRDRRKTRRRNKKNDSRKQHVVRRKMDTEDGGDPIYDIDTIVYDLQFGGGGVVRRTAATERSRTLHLIRRMVALGWESKYVNRIFQHLHDRVLNEWQDDVFIKQYFSTMFERSGSHSTIRESLVTIGIRSDVAIQLEKIAESLVNSSYTDTQVLDTIISYLLGDYAPIVASDASHLIEPTHVDMWLKYTHDDTKKLTIYNMSQQCSKQAISQFNDALSILPRADDSYYFYHTTSWSGSLSIFEGIHRFRGRTCLDFGIFPGFYMSETAADCIHWGVTNKSIWSNEVAVLIFSVPNTLPEDMKFKALDGEMWTDVTRQSRECKQRNELKSIKQYDLIYGNMVRNPTQVKYGRELPSTHTPAKKQLVGKSDRADAFIYSCLVGCVYFQKM